MKWSSSYPKGLSNIWDRHPAYLHFKVKEINSLNYDSAGHHRHTFENARSRVKALHNNKKDKEEKNIPYTGLSWPIHDEKDFFVRSYVGKPKYTKCSEYNGTLVSYVNDFEPNMRHSTPLPTY